MIQQHRFLTRNLFSKADQDVSQRSSGHAEDVDGIPLEDAEAIDGAPLSDSEDLDGIVNIQSLIVQTNKISLQAYPWTGRLS